MDDLRVEKYDAEKVEDKKKLIKKRVALAGGVIVVTLGLFSLTGCDDVRRIIEEQPERLVEMMSTPSPTPPPPMPAGGSGSWFASVLIAS